jgi:hypothetical protein
MALATTLYIQHGKAKAKATEVSTTLGTVIGRSIPIGMSWFLSAFDHKRSLF